MNIQDKNAVKHILQSILESYGYNCEAYNGPGKCLQITLTGERTLGTMMSCVSKSIPSKQYDEDITRVSIQVGDAFGSMRTHAFGSDVVVLFPSVCYYNEVP